jgi:hypothetical protein
MKSIHGPTYSYVQIGADETYTTLEMLPQDAKLVAAAPDLLAALERVLSHERDIVYLFNRLGEGSPANFSLDCEKARAAITTATA